MVVTDHCRKLKAMSFIKILFSLRAERQKERKINWLGSASGNERNAARCILKRIEEKFDETKAKQNGSRIQNDGSIWVRKV